MRTAFLQQGVNYSYFLNINIIYEIFKNLLQEQNKDIPIYLNYFIKKSRFIPVSFSNYYTKSY